MASWIWVLIPIVAILVGGFQEWLKFKHKQQQLGASARELEEIVAAQTTALEIARKEQDVLVQRIQNLEAIVTSQVWDVVHDDALPSPEKQRALTEARLQMAPPPAPEEVSDAERAEALARRLRV